ncbi:MAG: nucleoside 2-deoxyribosyltransferase domain-containing protein [Cyanobacteria bacterium]|nr:nucleoside 2-deoxyribosyltransferase domain-containing protein [Cyanobacteriota bacterium]
MQATVYLTGDSVSAHEVMGDPLGPDWRSSAMLKLQKYGLRVVNPLELAWTSECTEAIEISDSADKRVRRALDLIDECDALIANLEQSTYGTAMEIFYAHRRGKMVTVIGPSPYSPWVVTHSQARFGDLNRAIDFIIDKYPSTAPLSWALQYEAQLSERYEQIPPAGEPDYKFLGGYLPVLTVAPHATAYWREGEFHEQDAFSGALASILNRTTGCHSMLTNYCCIADPCWYLETPFRRAMTDVIHAGKIGYVLFVLGSSWQEAPGLQVSYYGPSDEPFSQYVQLLKTKLSEIEPVADASFDLQVRPLAKFVHEVLNVPSIVLRLHKRYRMPRLQPQLYSKVSSLLAGFIAETGAELARSRA